jgi:hypothetical protein
MKSFKSFSSSLICSAFMGAFLGTIITCFPFQEKNGNAKSSHVVKSHKCDFQSVSLLDSLVDCSGTPLLT